MSLKTLGSTAVMATGLLVALVACGNAGGGGGGGSAAMHTDTTVSAHSAGGLGTVLVDARGRTLYSPEQEAGGMIRCAGSCLHFWVPLTAPAGHKLTADTAVTASVGTVKRPDGTRQVVADGHPLYTFTLDKKAGSTAGDRFQDSFAGTRFTWHALSASGAFASSNGSGGSGGSGGYSY